METRLIKLIRADATPEDDRPFVEDAVFGTRQPEEIASWYARICMEHLGSAHNDAIFYAASAGCVAGVELVDGRRLVIKAYQGRWRADLLQLVSSSQRKLAAAGFPCPTPELDPFVFEGVAASVERLLPDPGLRILTPGEMVVSAQGLAVAGELLRDGNPVPWKGLHAFDPAPGALYPEPHSPLFDFTLRQDEISWVDELAAAGAAARDEGERRLGLFHCDWSARNIRITDGNFVASYDWDSLNACRESTAVGNAAATWRSTGDAEDPRAPGPDEIDEYLDAYVRATSPSKTKNATGTRSWRTAAMEEALWLLAYTARCEHAIEARRPEIRPRRARDTLEAEHTRFLAALRR